MVLIGVAVWLGVSNARNAPLELPWPTSAAGITIGDQTAQSPGSVGKTLPIASITKLITALVILDRVPLDDASGGPPIAITDRDAARTGELASAGLQVAPAPVGATVSARDALTLVIATSASNYAEMLAERVFGSEAAYVAAAQAWLKEHDFTETTIVDSTGASPENLSSVADVLEMGSQAASNDVIKRAAAQPFVPAPGDPTSRLRNTNGLLGVDGINGLKTGELGGSSIIITAPVEEDAAIVVVLNAASAAQRDTDALRLLAALKRGTR